MKTLKYVTAGLFTLAILTTAAIGHADLKIRKPVLLKANLVVTIVALHPVKYGKIKPGSGVNLSFTVKNNGPVATGRSASYSLSCTVLSGGPTCPVPNTTTPRSLPTIAAGASRNISLFGAIPAQAGRYRVYISVKPTTSRGRSRSVDINVGFLIRKRPGRTKYQR